MILNLVLKNKLYIFQVRPIVKSGKIDFQMLIWMKQWKTSQKLLNQIQNIQINYKKTIFGVMPDWNPAEIIGLRPNARTTLYKELITDETWAYQRSNYGYRNLRSHPLLVSFAEFFIDVRVHLTLLFQRILMIRLLQN